MADRRRGTAIFMLALGIVFFLQNTVFGAEPPLEQYVQSSAEYLCGRVPAAVGSEWTIIALARSGTQVPQEYFDAYLRSAQAYVTERQGVLHERKYTEYSRMILALTALGKNPADVGGYNLLAPLAEFEKTMQQGRNGAVFALLALDSAQYEISSDMSENAAETRQKYLYAILNAQQEDGGFSLSDGTDVDFTAMALQALAPYREKEEVEMAIQRGLQSLSKMQNAQGGFSSMGKENCESAAQVLTAMSTLQIPISDERFVKNGKTVLDYLLTFYREGGGFAHTSAGTEGDVMTTEQVLCAFAAYQRFQNGQKNLYDMSDVVRTGYAGQEQNSVGAFGKHEAVRVRPVVQPGKRFSDLEGYSGAEKILALAEREIVSGISEEEFAPLNSITRAEFAAIVTKGLGLSPIQTENFEDVPEAQWYAPYVGCAYSFGIVSGVSEHFFAPEENVTREEAVVMLTRAAHLCGLQTELTGDEQLDWLAQFTDYRTCADWAVNAMAFCCREKIISCEESELRPQEPALRGEIAQMLYQMLDAAWLLQ